MEPETRALVAAEEGQLPAYTMVDSLKYAVCTAVPLGVVDLFFQAPPIILFLSAFATFVAYRHGPMLQVYIQHQLEIHKQIRAKKATPALPAPAPPRHEEEAPSRQLRLSPDWQPDVEEINGLSIMGYGIKGAGKSNLGALLAEQFGQYHIPLVVFDVKPDYTTLVDVLPNGYIAGHSSALSRYDPNRFLMVDEDVVDDLGEAILSQGLQVIVDLTTYANDEQRAHIMTGVVRSLMKAASTYDNADRVPCLVFTDEASRMFPQDRSMKSPQMMPATYLELLTTFVEMTNQGRSLGIIPAWFDQRPANFDKRFAAESDVLIIMRQSQDVDIRRFTRILGPELGARVSTLQNGEAIVVMPGYRPFVTQFYKRKSRHLSHTPRAETAILRFGRAPAASGARALRTRYSGTHAPEAGTPVLMRRHAFTRTSTMEHSVQAPSASTERETGELPPPVPVQSARPETEDEARFTIEQEAEFMNRYKAEGSMRKAILAMHLGYGRYQKHASQIVRERKLRR